MIDNLSQGLLFKLFQLGSVAVKAGNWISLIFLGRSGNSLNPRYLPRREIRMEPSSRSSIKTLLFLITRVD